MTSSNPSNQRSTFDQKRTAAPVSTLSKNKPLLVGVVVICFLGAIVLAFINIFGGVQPGSPLPPDKNAPPRAVAAPGAPVDKNVIPPLAPGQIRQGAARVAPGTGK